MKNYKELCEEIRAFIRECDARADAENRYHIERDCGFGGDNQPYRVYEYTEEENATLANLRAEINEARTREEEEKKAKAEARKIAKAEKLGLTLEEYEEMKKTKAKITRYKREMEECANEIKRLEARMEQMRKFIEANE